MNPGHAATSGALTGLLFGCAICLIQNIPVVDSLFRVFVLTFACAWMGVLLAWLNQIIPGKMDQDSAKQKSQHSDSGL
ncbi:MAG: hypothetical protein AUJ57_11075 [Zetaproteobacteria bacterium CG1_02_53_45]|nr:MAG: hypothetical protein AUJ57_11075 [Zetaproteobacteria bacterium CG1_02_53_45]